ncbi:MAG: twin-arginine translocase subunit TatC [Actinomycetota bacterium]|nr:twin-arginine translocase subunit TatC [Actinomycetota bacterium]
MTATAPRAAGGGQPRAAGEMTLVEHLAELRARLVKSGIAVAVGFAVGFALRERVFALLIRPYCQLPRTLRAGSSAFDPDECSLVFTDPLGAFFISLKAAAVVAVVVAAPVVCYQLWRFVTPGLEDVERRYSLPFVVISQLLFLGGAVFSYLVIPRGLELLLSFAGPNVVSLMEANRYLTFILHTMLAFGVAFELPLILVTLSLMGVVTSESLRRHRRHALLGVFAAAAILTPTQDPLTMSLMAVPLVGLYEVAALAARLIERRGAGAAIG